MSSVKHAATSLGPVTASHRRTLTYRIIVAILTALALPLCWVLYESGAPIIGITSAVLIIAGVAWFFVAQSRERLVLCEGGLQLTRGKVVWSVAWSDIAGVFFVFDYNDLGEVRIETVEGRRVAFDLNWRCREALERAVVEALKDCPPMPTWYGLGVRLGRALGRMLGKKGVAWPRP